MTELEYVEKEIKKKQNNYNEWKIAIKECEDEDLTEDDKIEIGKMIANTRCRFETELATLNSVKQKLEAFEIIENHTIIKVYNNVLSITDDLENGTIETLISKQETDTLKEVLK